VGEGGGRLDFVCGRTTGERTIDLSEETVELKKKRRKKGTGKGGDRKGGGKRTNLGGSDRCLN